MNIILRYLNGLCSDTFLILPTAAILKNIAAMEELYAKYKTDDGADILPENKDFDIGGKK